MFPGLDIATGGGGLNAGSSASAGGNDSFRNDIAPGGGSITFGNSGGKGGFGNLSQTAQIGIIVGAVVIGALWLKRK